MRGRRPARVALRKGPCPLASQLLLNRGKLYYLIACGHPQGQRRLVVLDVEISLMTYLYYFYYYF